MGLGKVYKRIKDKFEDGVFTEGNVCGLRHYYFENDTIMDFAISKRTPEVCASLMHYSKCELSDVPEKSRTRNFYIDCFTDDDVYNYIKNNIDKFDRQFFKDLISTNGYATRFEKNCFEVMPKEYIDEEMCSLAILHATEWNGDEWLWSVYKRKPEALTSDIWKLAVRLYTRIYSKDNKYLNATPEEYRDEEYYKEMCSNHFNDGKAIGHPEITIMDTIPDEIIDKRFLLELLGENLENICSFNEKALETEISYYDNKKIVEKSWQFAIRKDGYLIRKINLNDERVQFFLDTFGKDSSEYRIGFKDYYKEYKRKKEATQRINRTEKENMNDIATRVLMNAFLYSNEGVDPSKAIDDETSRSRKVNSSLLPIKYKGLIPLELIKTYDSEEYLELLYKELGIEIIEEYDRLFYKVNLPEGWSIENSGYMNYVKDPAGNVVIEYFYDSKFYDREAYVKNVNIIEEKVFRKK